jgi:NAD(P)-dependent dehydrogenase (short-subunit alcohol dehydrogenase family)
MSRKIMIEQLFSVAGKVAVVTGGTAGIGAMIAEGLVKSGVKVYIVARNQAKGDEKVRELSAFGECHFIQGDISNIAGIQAVVEKLNSQESKLDILINNAGLLTLQEIDEVDEPGWDGPFDINVKAVFFLVQKLMPLLKAAGTDEDPARVINIGSAAGLQIAGIQYYSYSASKAGVHQLTRELASRLAREYINVNAIAPGVFPSDIGYEPPPEVTAQIMAGIPRGRLGQLEDIVGSIIYLSSRAGAFTTGVILSVDGGKVWA